MHIHEQQQGFSKVLTLVVIFVLCIGGYGLWKLTKNNDPVASTSRESNQAVSDETEKTKASSTTEANGLTTYTSKNEGLKFDYPSSWKKENIPSEFETTADYLTITSPNGNQVSWSSSIDGIGGHCDPEVDGTVTIAHFEELPKLKGIYYVELKQNGKFTEIGLMKDALGEPLKARDTGQCMLPAYFPSQKTSNGVWLRSTDFDATETADLATIKQIMLSARY